MPHRARTPPLGPQWGSPEHHYSPIASADRDTPATSMMVTPSRTDILLREQLTETKRREAAMAQELAMLKEQLQRGPILQQQPQPPSQQQQQQQQQQQAHSVGLETIDPNPKELGEPQPQPEPEPEPERELLVPEPQSKLKTLAAVEHQEQDENLPSWKRQFARREQAEQEVRRQLDACDLGLRQAVNTEEYLEAQRLTDEMKRLRALDFSDEANVAKVIGDEGSAHLVGGSARRCLRRLWSGPPRAEKLEANAARIQQLEDECVGVREEMLELGSAKRYKQAASLKREIMTKKDEIERLRAESHRLEMAVKDDARNRSEAMITVGDRVTPAENEQARSVLAAFNGGGTAADTQQQQLKNYHACFSAALKKLPIHVRGAGRSSLGRSYGEDPFEELISKHNGYKTNASSSSSSSSMSSSSSSGGSNGQQSEELERRSKWGRVRALKTTVVDGTDTLIGFSGDNAEADAIAFVHELNHLQLSGALGGMTCSWAPATDSDCLHKKDFVELMHVIDPTLFQQSAAASVISTEDALEELLRQVDRDGSGDVSWKEFSAAIKSFSSSSAGNLEAGVARLFQTAAAAAATQFAGVEAGGAAAAAAEPIAITEWEWDTHALIEVMNCAVPGTLQGVSSITACRSEHTGLLTQRIGESEGRHMMGTAKEILQLIARRNNGAGVVPQQEDTAAASSLNEQELTLILSELDDENGEDACELLEARDREGFGGTGTGVGTVQHWRTLRRRAEMAGAMHRLHMQARFGLSAKVEHVSTPQMRARQLSNELAWSVHHDDALFMAWSATQLALLMFIAVVTPLRVAFGVCAPWGSALFTSDLVTDSFFLVDIVLHFFVVEEDRNGIVDYTHSAIALRYLKSWFVLDLVSSIPVSFIILWAGSSGGFGLGGDHRFYLRVLRFIRLFKLVKLMHVKQKLTKLTVYIDDERLRRIILLLQSVLNVGKYVCMLFYMLHVMACCWYAAGCTTEYTEEDGLLEGWVIQSGWYSIPPPTLLQPDEASAVSVSDAEQALEVCQDGALMPAAPTCARDCFALDLTSAADQSFCDAVPNDGTPTLCERAGRCSTSPFAAVSCDESVSEWHPARCQYIVDPDAPDGDGAAAATDCDDKPTLRRRYMQAFLTSLDGSSYSYATVASERICTIVSLLAYQVFFGYLTATIASGILEGNRGRQRYVDKIQSVRDFCQTAGIRGHVRSLVLDHFRDRFPEETILDSSEIVPDLPPWLRHEVARELHGVWMRKIPIFMELNVNDLMTVFHHMKSMVVHQGHHIVRQGLPCNACFFVEEGVCQILKGKTFLGFIKAGSFFSENALHYNEETTRAIEDSSGTSSTSEKDRTGGTETPQEMFNVVADTEARLLYLDTFSTKGQAQGDLIPHSTRVALRELLETTRRQIDHDAGGDAQAGAVGHAVGHGHADGSSHVADGDHHGGAITAQAQAEDRLAGEVEGIKGQLEEMKGMVAILVERSLH
jgi:CRP-like cAMP-binding protein